jgi:hypothetical protein
MQFLNSSLIVALAAFPVATGWSYASVRVTPASAAVVLPTCRWALLDGARRGQSGRGGWAC